MNFWEHDDDDDDAVQQPPVSDRQSAATGSSDDLAMLMCGECDESAAMDDDISQAETMPIDGIDLDMPMCDECDDPDELDEDRSVTDHAPPQNVDAIKTALDAKAVPGNSLCFECDAPLTPWRDPWLSLTYGTLLCAACAQLHLSLGTDSGIGALVSSVRCATSQSRCAGLGPLL